MSSVDRLSIIFSKLCSLADIVEDKSYVRELIGNVYAIMNSNNPNKIGLYLSNGLEHKIQKLCDIHRGDGMEINRIISHIRDYMHPNIEKNYLCSCGAEISENEIECANCEECEKERNKTTRSREENVISHLFGWLDRIQGIENTTIRPEIIDKIVKKIREEHSMGGKIRDLTYLTLLDFREYLTQLGLNKHYKHIVKIRRLALEHFGIHENTPLLSEGDKHSIAFVFNKCYKAFNAIKNDPELLCQLDKENRSNILYYPYILYRILPNIIKDSRLDIFMGNILLQNGDTVHKDGIVWNKMIERYPDINNTHIEVYNYGSYIF